MGFLSWKSTALCELFLCEGMRCFYNGNNLSDFLAGGCVTVEMLADSVICTMFYVEDVDNIRDQYNNHNCSRRHIL